MSFTNFELHTTTLIKIKNLHAKSKKLLFNIKNVQIKKT